MLLSKSGIYLLGRGIPGLINFFGLIIFTRLLSTEDYGKYAIIISIIAMINGVCFLWIRTSISRFYIQYEDKDRKFSFLSTVYFSAIILVIVITFLCACVMLLFLFEFKTLLFFAILLLPLQVFFDITLELMAIKLNAWSYSAINLLKVSIAFLFGFAIIYLGGGTIGLIAGQVIGNIVALLFFSKGILEYISFRKFDPLILKQLISYGIPLSTTVIFVIIIDSSDRLILGALNDAASVGIYAATYDLTQQSIGMLMSVIHLAAYPLAVRTLEQKGLLEAREQLMKNASLLLFVSIPATVGLSLLSNEITRVILGESFQPNMALFVPMIALSVLVGGIKAFYFDLSFQLGRNTIYQIWSNMGAACVNIGLNFLLIPILGLMGAAYSTLVSYGLGLILSLYFGKKVFRMPFPIKSMFQAIVASGGMTSFLFVLNKIFNGSNSILLAMKIFSGTLCYFIILSLINKQIGLQVTRFFASKIKDTRKGVS